MLAHNFILLSLFLRFFIPFFLHNFSFLANILPGSQTFCPHTHTHSNTQAHIHTRTELVENFKLKFCKVCHVLECVCVWANTAHNFAQIFDKYFRMLISRERERPKYQKAHETLFAGPHLSTPPFSFFWVLETTPTTHEMDQRIYCCIIKFLGIKQAKKIVSVPQLLTLSLSNFWLGRRASRQKGAWPAELFTNLARK